MIETAWVIETGWMIGLTLSAGLVTWGICYPWFLYLATRKE